jgi:hypothetical protein
LALGCAWSRIRARTYLQKQPARCEGRLAESHVATSTFHTKTRRCCASTRTSRTSRSRGIERWGAHGRSSGVKPSTYTEPTRHEGRNTEARGTARRPAPGAAARRGVFLGLTCNGSNARAPARRHPAATVLGRRGARLQQRRRGSVAVHGGTMTEPARSGSTAHSQAGIQRKDTAQGKARLRVGSRWVDDVVVAGLTKVVAPGRRSRLRPASCAAPASRSTRTLPSPRGNRSGSTRSRTPPSSGTSAAARRTAVSFPPPLPFPPRGSAHRKRGKTPIGSVRRS